MATHPGRVRLVDLVEHDDGGAAVIKHQPPEICRGDGQWVRRHHKGGWPKETVHQCCVDVVAAIHFCGDEKGQGSVRRQHIHAPVLLSISGQQWHTAFLHIQVRCYRIQCLIVGKKTVSRNGKWKKISLIKTFMNWCFFSLWLCHIMNTNISHQVCEKQDNNEWIFLGCLQTHELVITTWEVV